MFDYVINWCQAWGTAEILEGLQFAVAHFAPCHFSVFQSVLVLIVLKKLFRFCNNLYLLKYYRSLGRLSKKVCIYKPLSLLQFQSSAVLNRTELTSTLLLLSYY